MKPSKKPFSKHLYDNDDSAKHIIVDWLNGMGFQAEINPERYGIDVVSVPAGLVGIEVEVKHNWKGPTFQYDTLHYSWRKTKFLDSAESIFFITLNHEKDCMLIVGEDALQKAAKQAIYKDTKYTSHEMFMEIPIADCEYVQLNNGK